MCLAAPQNKCAPDFTLRPAYHASQTACRAPPLHPLACSSIRGSTYVKSCQHSGPSKFRESTPWGRVLSHHQCGLGSGKPQHGVPVAIPSKMISDLEQKQREADRTDPERKSSQGARLHAVVTLAEALLTPDQAHYHALTCLMHHSHMANQSAVSLSSTNHALNQYVLESFSVIVSGICNTRRRNRHSSESWHSIFSQAQTRSMIAKPQRPAISKC